MPRFVALLAMLLYLPLAMLRSEVLEPEALEPDFGLLAEGESGRAVEVVDGDTLLLESGTEIRLVGIQAPKLPLGRSGFVAWPLAEEAKRALEGLALGRELTLYYGGRKKDRYGRMLTHLVRRDGLWLQGALLGGGWARVYSFRDNRALIDEMLARERAARLAGSGIWALDYYAVLTPEEAGYHVGSFQLVEGRVVDSAIVRRRGYINFGEDWKSDFTIAIKPRDRKQFGEGGADILSYKGRIVRVRGWIKSYNGAMIEATHPEQIEVFE
jgi:endonuclease YncB( thermonuclease family)